MGGSTKPSLMPRRPVTTLRPQTGVVGLNNVAPKMQGPGIANRLPPPKPQLPKMQMGLMPPMGIRSPGTPDLPMQNMPQELTPDIAKQLGVLNMRGPGFEDVDEYGNPITVGQGSMFNPGILPRTQMY